METHCCAVLVGDWHSSKTPECLPVPPLSILNPAPIYTCILRLAPNPLSPPCSCSVLTVSRCLDGQRQLLVSQHESRCKELKGWSLDKRQPVGTAALAGLETGGSQKDFPSPSYPTLGPCSLLLGSPPYLLPIQVCRVVDTPHEKRLEARRWAGE